LKWADGKLAKSVLDEVILRILGPFTPEDEEAAKRGKVAKKKPTASAPAPAAVAAPAAPTEAENPFAARDLAAAKNSEKLLQEHAAITGGKIRTRFPPEPNGFLHIGHAKSMCLNFESAFKWLGAGPDRTDVTFRYDDTNPEAESMEYIENQVALVLGTVRCVSIR
jgi:glutaminyl-tRNA synthetase